MQVSGACPGMVLVQLGAGVPWSYLTFIGALLGALAHGLVEKWLSSGSDKLKNLITAKAIFEVIHVPAFVIRIAFIVILGLAVFFMEFFIPWTNEYPNAVPSDSQNIFIYKAWPPFGNSFFYIFTNLFPNLGFFHLKS